MRAPSVSSFTTWLIKVLAIAAAYYVTGKLGLLLAIPPGYASAVWPASGIALAGILLLGYRVWPGILLGSFLINAWTGVDATDTASILKSLSAPIVIGGGAALQAVVGAALVRQVVGFPNPLVQASAIAKFLILAGPISCLTNATIGTTSLLLANTIPGSSYLFSWWTWWVGDTIGVLVVTPLVLVWTAEPREVWGRRKLSLALPLCVTFALAVVIFVIASRWEHENLELEFEQRASAMAQTVTKHFDEYIGVLYSIESLYTSSDRVDRQKFRMFVQRFFSLYPGIQALSWNPRIEHSARAAYEEKTVQEGFPHFQITERDPQGRLLRASQRSEYTTVSYLEPFEGNAPAFGFDVASDPVRLKALNQARDKGKAIATASIKLVQETDQQFGLLIFLPIYKNGLPRDTVDERRQSLRGYATGVFRIGDTMQAVLSTSNSNNIKVQLHDISAPPKPQLLYNDFSETHNSGGSATNTPGPGKIAWAKTVEVAGRQWRLSFSPTLEYLAAHRSWNAWAVLAGGLLFTGLLGAFLLVVTGRTIVIERLGSKHKRAEERLRLVVESAPNAIVMTNQRGEIMLVNSAMEKAFGYERQTLLGQPFEMLIPKRLLAEHPEYANLFTEPRTHSMGQLPDFIGVRKDGSEFPAEIGVNPIDTDDGILVLIAIVDVTERKRAEEELAQHAKDLGESRQTLRNLALSLQELREQERTAVAREVHDELGQALTALRIDLAWLMERLPKDRGELQDRGRAMADLVGSSVDSVRRIASSLRPAILDDLGLAAAIEWMAKEFEARTAIPCLVHVDDLELSGDGEANTAAFRIVQEALTNVSRHANATKVEINLTRTGDEIALDIVDNGVGIGDAAPSDSRSLGLLGMYERAASLGWRLDIAKNVGGGTRVALRIPHSRQQVPGDREALREHHALF